jgi:hypothetical protein
MRSEPMTPEQQRQIREVLLAIAAAGNKLTNAYYTNKQLTDMVAYAIKQK